MDARTTNDRPQRQIVDQTGSPIDETTAEALDVFLHALAEARFPFVRKVLLYGSRARGDHHPDSDVDVAVVVTGDRIVPKGMDVRGATFRARGLHDDIVSPLTMPEEGLDNPDASSSSAFFRNVNRDGIELVLPDVP